MIAFHFPPMRDSSGIQRTLKFAHYLSQIGWQPLVLSAHRRAYANVSDSQLHEIPDEVVVERAFALDASRHLAVNGRYPRFLALPDRWISWWLGAVPAGLGLIRRHRPDVIWSTYPIATAHLIGLALHWLSGIPWVVDMRDPMSDDAYPTDPFLHRLYEAIENRVIRRCSKVVCTSAGAAAAYRMRFAELPISHFCVIENGFDEDNFADAEQAAVPIKKLDGPMLVHSGVIYPSERDPIPLFQALQELKQQGRIVEGRFLLVLRASGHDAYLAGLIAKFGIARLVTLAPHIAYRAALSEMLCADGLLLLQASNCNHQVPAKLYEYLRARRPILALTDPEGATAAILRNAGINTTARLDSKDEIMNALQNFLAAISSNTAPIASEKVIVASSRSARTLELDKLLTQVINDANGHKP